VTRKASLILLLLLGILLAGYHSLSGTSAKVSEAKSASKPALLSDCNRVSFESSLFTHCIAKPGKHSISTKITGKNGVIYRGFISLSKDINKSKVAFAFNGGMYDAGSNPIGYYAENGQRLQKLNRRSGSGNFHLLPNGVFFGDKNGNWQVMTSDDFANTVTQRPNFGTQSGPMLLINGQFHPKISADGDSLKIRNAVGVDINGNAHFVISEAPVSFGRITRMLRDKAKTPNALFLDGTVSGLWHPASGRMDSLYPLGPLIVVTKISKEPVQ
jgi:uncharacterized protein YigE (DUF2233 family)